MPLSKFPSRRGARPQQLTGSLEEERSQVSHYKRCSFAGNSEPQKLCGLKRLLGAPQGDKECNFPFWIPSECGASRIEFGTSFNVSSVTATTIGIIIIESPTAPAVILKEPIVMTRTIYPENAYYDGGDSGHYVVKEPNFISKFAVACVFRKIDACQESYWNTN